MLDSIKSFISFEIIIILLCLNNFRIPVIRTGKLFSQQQSLVVKATLKL